MGQPAITSGGDEKESEGQGIYLCEALHDYHFMLWCF